VLNDGNYVVKDFNLRNCSWS